MSYSVDVCIAVASVERRSGAAAELRIANALLLGREVLCLPGVAICVTSEIGEAKSGSTGGEPLCQNFCPDKQLYPAFATAALAASIIAAISASSSSSSAAELYRPPDSFLPLVDDDVAS